MSDFFDLAAREQFDATPGNRRYSWITGGLEPLTSGDKAEIDKLAGKLRRAAQSSAPESERCTLTELPKDSCSHCRPQAPRPPVKVDGKYRLIEARYDGRCAVCDEPYMVGQTIARIEGGGWAGSCHLDWVGQ